MSTIARGTKSAGGTDFTAHTDALSAELNTDLNTIVSGHNNHDAGTSKWTVVSALNASAVPLIADNGAGSNDVANFKANGSTVVKINSTGKTTFSDNILFSPTTKGIVGTTSNDSAAVGNVGEIISATRLRSAETGLSTGTGLSVVSISLTAGQWLLIGYVGIDCGATTSFTICESSISTTNNTLSASDSIAVSTAVGLMRSTFNQAATVPTADRVYAPLICAAQVAGTTTYYLVAQATFSVSTAFAYGSLVAVRTR